MRVFLTKLLFVGVLLIIGGFVTSAAALLEAWLVGLGWGLGFDAFCSFLVLGLYGAALFGLYLVLAEVLEFKRYGDR